MADDRVERERERELNIRENGERREGNVIITPRIRRALGRSAVNKKTYDTWLPCTLISMCPRNRRGSSQVHITRRRFNMTFPPSPKRRAKEGASERRTNDCRCGTHEFKAFQNDFFLSPSSAPAPVPPSLSLVHACALGIRQEVGKQRDGATGWFCPGVSSHTSGSQPKLTLPPAPVP